MLLSMRNKGGRDDIMLAPLFKDEMKGETTHLHDSAQSVKTAD